MRDKLKRVVVNKNFKRVYTALGLIFIVLTYFISVSPDSFLQFGYLGIIVFNMVSSGLLVLPVLVQKFNIIGVVLASAVGNIPNTSINYLLGYSSNSLFSGNTIVEKLKNFMRRYGLIAVYILSVIPLPLDINGLLSGYLGINYTHYILVNFLGKITVFTLAALGVISFTQLSKNN